MSAKHTPGPWTAQNDGRDIISIQHSNNDPGAISMTLAKVTARMTWRSQSEANARLIAAAPDLLDALQYLAAEFRSVVNSEFATHRCPDPAKDDPAYLKAMAAITKAIG